MATEEDKKKNWFVRHKVLSVILALVVIVILASALGGSDKSKSGNSTNSKSQSKTSTAATTAKIGETARDGKFEFVVNSMKCGQPSVSDSSGYLSKAAQGQYCIVNITAKNIGNEAQMLDGSNQYLYNASKQKYSYDSTATIYANPSDSTFLNNINPGNSATGDFVFDVPKDVTPVTAELHDSAFSNGVKVQLQ